MVSELELTSLRAFGHHGLPFTGHRGLPLPITRLTLVPVKARKVRKSRVKSGGSEMRK